MPVPIFRSHPDRPNYLSAFLLKLQIVNVFYRQTPEHAGKNDVWLMGQVIGYLKKHIITGSNDKYEHRIRCPYTNELSSIRPDILKILGCVENNYIGKQVVGFFYTL